MMGAGLRYGVPNCWWNLRKEGVRDVMLDAYSGISYAVVAENEVGTAEAFEARSEIYIRASGPAPLTSADYLVNWWRYFGKYAIARCDVIRDYVMRDIM